MEFTETAACGISQREFAIEFDAEELVHFYRILLYSQEGTGFYDEDYLEDLKSQMSYIIGPALEEDPSEDTIEENISWEDTGASYLLHFNEDIARKLNQILTAVEHSVEGFDKTLNKMVIDQMLEMAPNILDNLPMMNR